MPAYAETSGDSVPGYRREPIEDYQTDELPVWRPRQRGTGDGGYHGSNVELGTPDTVADDLREKLLEQDELLAFAAEMNQRRRIASEALILARGALYRKLGSRGEDGIFRWVKEFKSASAREHLVELELTALVAADKDARLAWELVVTASNTQRSQLEGIRSIGARLGQQMAADGRAEYDSYTNQDRRRAAQGAGRRKPGY